MPVRQIPLVNDEVYHICNRGIDRRPTFTAIKDYRRVLFVLKYYQYLNPPVRLSRLLSLQKEQQKEILNYLEKENDKLIDIICYCFMPNHYHILVKQLSDKGISTFISKFQNSYTKYFNIVHKKEGPLFLDQFKAVRIESDEQLVHVSRYIHINPFTSFVVKDIDSLCVYQWSSLNEYLDINIPSVCRKDLVMSLFKNIKDYKNFIIDQTGYQRELAKIEHLTLED